MSETPHELLDQAIGQALEMCRDTLAVIEERFREWETMGVGDERLAWLQAQVGAYGQLVAALREYAGHAERGRRRPGPLAERLDAFAQVIDDVQAVPEASPSGAQARDLAALARTFVT